MLRALALSTLVAGFAAALAGAEEPAQGPDPAWLGCWANDEEGATRLRVDPDRVILSIGGNRLVGRILAVLPGGLRLRLYGMPALLDLAREGEDLRVTFRIPASPEPPKAHAFRKLPSVPEELELKPLALGKPDALAPEKVAEIQKDLETRGKKDQEVRGWLFKDPQAYLKDPSILAKMRETDCDNTAWLKKAIGEAGWIDAVRFGAPAASSAFLIVQHSGDLPLMMAALPEIEKDLAAKRVDAQEYALLYDRCHIALGEKQRFGSQVNQDEKGRLCVLPLEDRARVDEFRQAIGLVPLSAYLKMVATMGGGGEPVFLEDGEEAGKKGDGEGSKAEGGK